MRVRLTFALLLCVALGAATPALAYPPRTDVIWARSTMGAKITLDGVLNEPAWANAETKVIQYRVDAGIPGSGWKEEGGILATDRTNVTMKFLTEGDSLYVAFIVPDNSIGGSNQFNRFDGFLMNLRDHSFGTSPAPVAEYLYSWWYPSDPDTLDPGQGPAFKGSWAVDPPGSVRTPEQIAAWDAACVVNGVANQDSINHVFIPDVGYTVEMKFNLKVMGYHITQPEGDVAEWNVSIYDTDCFWPINIYKFSVNRTWWQSPWGNVGWYHEVRINARPDVTINSGPVPEVPPELIIPNASGFAPPTIDGNLNEPVWASAPSIPIRYDDAALRESYPGIARWRAGQFQPEVNGGVATVEDPLDATVKYFFKGNNLYVGFDVNDAVVQYYTLEDRWDAVTLSLNDRGATNPDHVLFPRRFVCRVGPTGQADPLEYLDYLINTLHGGEVGLMLKPGTTVDTLGATGDVGYSVEMRIDLTKLGYPNMLGDHLLFMGLCLYDGDSFTPITKSYGTRTWWFREREGMSSSCWAYLDVNTGVVGVDDGPAAAATNLALLGNTPNPFRSMTNIRFTLPAASRVTLEVFDLQGRTVHSGDLGLLAAGPHQAGFSAGERQPGLYLYRLHVTDASSGAARGTLAGKMMVLK